MGSDKRAMTVMSALQWAFVTERASLNLDLHDDREGGGAVGTEYIILQRMKLGTHIDASKGASKTHDDADLIAVVLSQIALDLGGVRLALIMGVYAKSGVAPDWMPGATPLLRPVAVNKSGMAKTEVIARGKDYFTMPHPRNKNRPVKRSRSWTIEWCPCRWNPSHAEIKRARAAYADWHEVLRETRDRLMRVDLDTIEITPRLPDPAPWERSS